MTHSEGGSVLFGLQGLHVETTSSSDVVVAILDFLCSTANSRRRQSYCSEEKQGAFSQVQ
jgi:hypothetical protein